ncbi:MAG TPA: DUF1176 domain-containing protein [Pyrinomonadaceae bacterium]|nr:DUF1176 domain-containing protein [Pyrinomonadaceae bacterium]
MMKRGSAGALLALALGAAAAGGCARQGATTGAGAGATPAAKAENATARQTASPAQQTPPPPQQPTARAATPPKSGELTREDRNAWRGILRWPDDCERAYERTSASVGGAAKLEFYELASGRHLVRVTCAGGAYQPSQVFALLDETGAQPSAKVIRFEAYESPGDDLEKVEAEELWGLADFDAKTKRLRVLNKFRGPGDCGTLATYAFNETGAKLVELRAKTRCDGRGAEDPESWKKIVPAP